MASSSDLTPAELEERAANIRAHGDTSRRGVAEALDEARRQFGFAGHGAARYWLDQAECASNLITAREMNDRIVLRSARARPLQWGTDPAVGREAEAGDTMTAAMARALDAQGGRASTHYQDKLAGREREAG